MVESAALTAVVIVGVSVRRVCTRFVVHSLASGSIPR